MYQQKPTKKKRPTNANQVRQVHPLNQTKFPVEKPKIVGRNATTGSTPYRSRKNQLHSTQQSSITKTYRDTELSFMQPNAFYAGRQEQASTVVPQIIRHMASGGQVQHLHTKQSLVRLSLPPKLQSLALHQEHSAITSPSFFNQSYSQMTASNNFPPSEIPTLNFSNIKPQTAGNYMNTPKPLVMPLNSQVLIQTKGQRYQPSHILDISCDKSYERFSTLIPGTPQPSQAKNMIPINSIRNPNFVASLTGRSGTSRTRSRFTGLSSSPNTLPSKLQSRFLRTGTKLPGLDQSRNKFNSSRTTKKPTALDSFISPSALLSKTIEPGSPTKSKLSESLNKMALVEYVSMPRGQSFQQNFVRQESKTDAHRQIKTIITEQSKRYRSERRKVFEIEQQKQEAAYQQQQIESLKQRQGSVEDEEVKPYTRMPGGMTMRMTVQDNLKERKRRILREMAGENSDMEGMLQVKRSKTKTQVKNYLAIKVKQYERNFTFKSHKVNALNQSDRETLKKYAELLTVDKHTKALSKRNMIANIKEIYERDMTFKVKLKAKQKFTQGQGKKVDRSKVHQSIFEISDGTGEQNKAIEHRSTEVDQRFKNNAFIKKCHLDNSQSGEGDKEIKTKSHQSYMLRCLEALDVSLPILDKILSKTLCLRNYRLSDGHCSGLAEACKYLDHRVVNRILLQNNGITGDQLASILDGTVHMTDFKAFIYKHNSINQASVDSMAPILRRDAPFQLEELVLIDCKLNGSVLENLLELLRDARLLKKFTLIKPAHHERSFDKLVELVQNSQHLVELDVSWQGVRPQTMIKLLRVLEKDRFLHSLSIGYNRLLEESGEVYSSETGFGCAQPLGHFNNQALGCLKEMIKFNINLVHLDIQATGLNATAMLSIANTLRTSWSLQCVHLCGNTGIAQQVEPRLREALGSKDISEPTRVIPMQRGSGNTNSNNGENLFAAVAKLFTQSWSEIADNNMRLLDESSGVSDSFRKAVKDLLSPITRVFEHIGAKICYMEMRNRRQRSLRNSKDGAAKQKDSKVQWSDIRSGLRRQSIEQQIQMSKLTQVAVSVEFNKMIVQRQIGLGGLIPGASRWRVDTQQRDECWHCGQYVLSVFFWTPKTGFLAASSDEDMIKFYRKEIENETGENLSEHPAAKPVIRAPFTNWNSLEMCDVIQFCEENDAHEPDFIGELSREGSIRFACAGDDPKPLNSTEKTALAQYRRQYYEENWHKVVMASLGCQRAQVACRDRITFEQLKQDQEDGVTVFCSAAWVKPGRNVYTVQSGEELQVFHLLSDFRSEPVPVYHKDRHVERGGVLAEVNKTNQVFSKWVEDTFDIQQQIFSADYHRNQLDSLIHARNETQSIQNLIQVELSLFKSIYNELQARATQNAFPLIDFETAFSCLINECLGVSNDSQLQAKLRVIAERSCENSKTNRDRQVSTASEYVVNRALLLEIHLRFAFHLFECDEQQAPHSSMVVTEEEKVEAGSAQVTQTQALFLYIETKLKPFAATMKMTTQDWRETQLWTSENERLFSSYEPSLQTLYNRYSAILPHQDVPGTMSLAACQKLFSQGMPISLHLTPACIHKAFIFAQQTVIDETDGRYIKAYFSLSYAEFLEVIGRIACLSYEGTDKESAPLHEKILTLLMQFVELLKDEPVARSNRFELIARDHKPELVADEQAESV